MLSKVVVMTGLPGTGKSAIAEVVASTLLAPVFAKDRLEAPLLQSGISGNQLGRLGYEIMSSLLESQLRRDQSVVLDSVASSESIRSHWRRLTEQYAARWYVIECICSDLEVHRTRLNGRTRGIPGWPELTWSEVERVKKLFAPWEEPRLVLDAVKPLSENAARALEFIKAPAHE